MSKKSPRRMPILFTAEQLDYKESVARNENKRVRKRLELKRGTINGHENINLSSMNHEMRRLKHELKGIKETSGYFILNHEASGGLKERATLEQRARRRNKTKVAKKKQLNAEHMSEVDSKTTRSHNKISRKTDGIPSLPNISHSHKETQVTSGSRDHVSKLSNPKITDSSYVNKTLVTTTDKNIKKTLTNSYDVSSSEPAEITVSNEEENGIKNCVIRPLSREFSKSDTKLDFDMDSVRGRIQNRLAGNAENSNQVIDDSDLSPFMHVPPDGLPRTVYLLPPLKDLLKEAKKARYIRKLRKPHTVIEDDDPERELNIDEIFRKT